MVDGNKLLMARKRDRMAMNLKEVRPKMEKGARKDDRKVLVNRLRVNLT